MLLELFSGTCSVGRAFRAAGWDVCSVDNDASTHPTILADARALTLDMLPRIPDLIWASPVCTHYSKARTRAKAPPDLEWADSLVQACLDLQRACGCPMLFENPHSGLLRTRPLVQGIPYRTVDYCKYSDERFPHTARKRTAIWCVDCDWQPSRPLCKHDCGYCEGGRHLQRAQQGSVPRAGIFSRHSLKELYAIPPALCEEIAAWACANVFG